MGKRANLINQMLETLSQKEREQLFKKMDELEKQAGEHYKIYRELTAEKKAIMDGLLEDFRRLNNQL